VVKAHNGLCMRCSRTDTLVMLRQKKGEVMQVIILTETEVDEAFFKAERQIRLTGDFQKNDEVQSEFKKTQRYEMLQMFRKSLANVKEKIKAT